MVSILANPHSGHFIDDSKITVDFLFRLAILFPSIVVRGTFVIYSEIPG